MYKLFNSFLILLMLASVMPSQSQTLPTDIKFVRQGAKRMIFDEDQQLTLAKLDPAKIVGFDVMHPVKHLGKEQAAFTLLNNKLSIASKPQTRTTIWLGGFNPFATYSIDLASISGEGEFGFKFGDENDAEQLFVTVGFKKDQLTDAKLKVIRKNTVITDNSIRVNAQQNTQLKGKLLLQLIGSGLVLYLRNDGLPQVIGQADINKHIDVRAKAIINSFQSHLYFDVKGGGVSLNKAEIALTTGNGLADIRAITYENGEPMLDKGRLWYTMSIRGRALPHHLQGVFSMDPTLFDVKLEGIILFDRNDGLLRNEVASHIFYDRESQIWRGITTGFSAYANIDKEKKQLLAVESKRDPRFGFSVMTAKPFGIVGDIEDPHILYDHEAGKWRILTCENNKGYKAILLESDTWNSGYKKIAGPVLHNSTGTSIQRINGKLYCFSGSNENKLFVYSYPELKEIGTLKMDLPPWNDTSGSRVWPNVVQLPDGYPLKYVALTMDRFNYPGLIGPNWTYGALYLYHGN